MFHDLLLLYNNQYFASIISFQSDRCLFFFGYSLDINRHALRPYINQLIVFLHKISQIQIATLQILPTNGKKVPQNPTPQIKITRKQETANNNNNQKKPMQNNLMKIHELIMNIERNINNYKKVRDNCSELEQIIEYIQPTTKYHYMLFLVEIYAAKLRDFQNAERLCKKVTQDRRLSVEVQGTLRMNFINALQHQYSEAIKNLQEVDILSENKQDLEMIVLNYFERMFLYSKESNLLNGGKCEQLQKYEEAIQYYNQEFEAEILDKEQIENKYYAAKAILRVISSFTGKKFTGVDETKYKEYLMELAQEKEEQDNTAAIDKIDKNYKNQKIYHQKIIEIILKKQASLKKSRSFTKNTTALFNIQLENKRILAIFKLQKVLNSEKKLHPLISAEFKKCLSELQHNSINNYTMLHEFTAKQLKIANRGTQLLKKMLRKPIFTYLKAKYLHEQSGEHKIKPKRQSLFQNLPNNNNESPTRFTRHPIQDQIQTNFNMKLNQVHSELQTSQIPESFKGSHMEKINDTSDGHELRYFYFVQTELTKGKLKLYYNTKQSKISSDDSFYDLKRFRGLIEGKTTKAFKRSQCSIFQQDRCFSIMLEDKVHKNFYVPDKKDYAKWIAVFKKYSKIKGMSSSPIKNPVDKTKYESQMRKTVIF